MRKIFIDCGYYRGKGIRLFKKRPEYDDSFEFFAFDPNKMPDNHDEEMKKKNITFFNKALWTFDGEISFYASGRVYGQANSVFPNPSKPRREKKRTIECIDFDKWIKDNFSPDDYIVVKMDIEGAEYDILYHMLNEGSIHYVDLMFVEYHYERRPGTGREDFSKLRKRLKSETNVKFTKAIEW